MTEENEKKREYLMEYQKAKKDVQRLQTQLQELRLNKISPSCVIGDGMPHALAFSDLSDYAVKVDEIEQDIKMARYRRIRAFQRVREYIEALSDEREKLLLTYRYLRGWSWEKISVDMCCGIRTVYYIHGTALSNLKKIA